ncbi:YHS domain-containing protein [Candidatus Woesearchaeota archaeon]|nr:YHS domain-containing protein [Candidatus Woesearchaeota archaeon]
MAKDPVCGMEAKEGKITSKYKCKTYSFCSSTCKWAFDSNPKQFVK